MKNKQTINELQDFEWPEIFVEVSEKKRDEKKEKKLEEIMTENFPNWWNLNPQVREAWQNPKLKKCIYTPENITIKPLKTIVREILKASREKRHVLYSGSR